MKTRKQKQDDLNALTEQFKNSNTALVIGFNKLTVAKDQELRNQLREIGAKYKVVKNTIAGLATKDEAYGDPEIYKFKVGIVEGKVVSLSDVQDIANLPSKEELLSKIMYVINCQAERLVTVINAVPQDLASVIKQIGDKKEEA
jgi:large subunit ribosomal protein L10